MGFVDAHRPLHGQALGGGALGGEFVGVGLALQGFPAGVDGCHVLRVGARQVKEGEVVVVEFHGVGCAWG